MQSIIIKDKKGRILLKTKGNRCVIARYDDLDEEMKNGICELYSEITGTKSADVLKFLNFKSDVQEFCS